MSPEGQTKKIQPFYFLRCFFVRCLQGFHNSLALLAFSFGQWTNIPNISDNERQPNTENLVRKCVMWTDQPAREWQKSKNHENPTFCMSPLLNFSVTQLSMGRMLHKAICWFGWDIWVIQWRQPVKYLCDINTDPETAVPKVWSVGANPVWRQCSQRQCMGWQDKRQQLQWIMRAWAVQKSKRENT